jgi:hypothetical protein
MKRILFILVCSVLFLTVAKSQKLTLLDPGNIPASLVVGDPFTFTYTVTNALGTLIRPHTGTPTAVFTALSDSKGPATATVVVTNSSGIDPNAFQVTVTPTHNGAFDITVSAVDAGSGNTVTSHILSSAVNAVELTDFSAKPVSASKVNLNWITASEKDNSMFKVEQSTNGVNFSAIGEVKGSGTSAIAHEYAYTDNNSYAAAVVYYRLISVDFAGSQSSSKIVSVTTGNKGKLSLDVVKNDGRVIFVSPVNENVTLSVYNLAGREVSHSTLAAYQGANNVSVDFSNLNAGLYIARLSNSNDAANFKFVKN